MHEPLKRFLYASGVSILVAGLSASLVGCGWLADKGRIQIAKLRNEPITRADLKRVLREMPDDKRPRIETRSDVRRVLEKYLDERIKKELSDSLKAQNKIHVPRELAAQEFARQFPDFTTDIPDPDEFGVGNARKVLEDERESAIDRIQEQMYGEMAVRYRIQEAIQSKLLTITPEEYQKEYELLKAQLMTRESVTFHGIWYERSSPTCEQEAAALRARLDKGEKLEAVAKEFPPDRLMRAGILNDPSQYKFRAFWSSAQGSKVGSIIGPVPVTSPSLTMKDAQGQLVKRDLPDILLVAEILDATPARQMSLEEAKDDLSGLIYYRKMMDMLYREYGREIYEDKLEDPAMLSVPKGGGPLKSGAPMAQ